MIRLQAIPPLVTAHCCQCENEIFGPSIAFVATLDEMVMGDGFRGTGQITCFHCVLRMLEQVKKAEKSLQGGRT